MWKNKNTSMSIMLSASILFGFSLSTSVVQADMAADIAQGKQIAFDRKKGNCLACHVIAGGDSAGNIGPVLSNIKARFPNRPALRDRIWDATAINPNTRMPPFGKNRILTEAEIDLVLTFLYTL